MKKVLMIITLMFVPLISKNLYSQIGIDIETGFIKSGYNDVRIPGDNGTLFSFSDELKSDNDFFYRLRLNYKSIVLSITRNNYLILCIMKLQFFYS